MERFVALITGRTIRRGTFHSAQELEKAIYRWLGNWNGDPVPFAWKASADVILDKVTAREPLSTGLLPQTSLKTGPPTRFLCFRGTGATEAGVERTARGNKGVILLSGGAQG